VHALVRDSQVCDDLEKLIGWDGRSLRSRDRIFDRCSNARYIHAGFGAASLLRVAQPGESTMRPLNSFDYLNVELWTAALAV